MNYDPKQVVFEGARPGPGALLESRGGSAPLFSVLYQRPGQLVVGNGLTDGETLPGTNFLYAWEVNENVTVAGSTQANRAVDAGSGEAYSEIAQSATVVLGLSDEIGMFTEWFAMFPNGADTAQVEHYLDGGFTFLLSNDVQFDIRAGYGLSRSADDFFVGTGLSIRFQ